MLTVGRVASNSTLYRSSVAVYLYARNADVYDDNHCQISQLLITNETLFITWLVTQTGEAWEQG